RMNRASSWKAAPTNRKVRSWRRSSVTTMPRGPMGRAVRAGLASPGFACGRTGFVSAISISRKASCAKFVCSRRGYTDPSTIVIPGEHCRRSVQCEGRGPRSSNVSSHEKRFANATIDTIGVSTPGSPSLAQVAKRLAFAGDDNRAALLIGLEVGEAQHDALLRAGTHRERSVDRLALRTGDRGIDAVDARRTFKQNPGARTFHLGDHRTALAHPERRAREILRAA